MSKFTQYRIVQVSPYTYRVERAIPRTSRMFWRPWRRVSWLDWVGVHWPAPSPPFPSLQAACQYVHQLRTYPLVVKSPA